MALSIAKASAGTRYSTNQQCSSWFGSGPRVAVRQCSPVKVAPKGSRTRFVARADSRNSDSSFFAGFMVGGVVFGALGFIFAPQISRALLGDDQRIKLPKFLEEEQQKDPEQTRQDLIEKIALLNASIDEVSAQLKTKDTTVQAEPETIKLG